MPSDEEKQTKAAKEAEAKAEQARIKAEDDEKARVKLEDEAATLGITKSKVRIPTRSKKIKDHAAEERKHKELINKRLKNRIAKANAKSLSTQATRKRLIKARLTHSIDYPKEQVKQWRGEWDMMNMRKWRPGRRMPKVKSVYDEIMDED